MTTDLERGLRAMCDALIADLNAARTEIERQQKALAANICPECERIDDADAWGEET